MQHYGEPDPIDPGSVGGAGIAAAEAALEAVAEGEGAPSDCGYEAGTMWTGHPVTPPAPEQGQGRWTEGVCGDGAAILFDGAMVPIEEVVRALNGRPTPPVPELLEANFRAWYKEARGSLYYGAMLLCDAIEWAQHLLQQVTLQALVSPAAPAPPITEPSALPELVRYGFIGDGPNRPLLVRLVDGYWTPWHIAATLLQQQEAELAALRGVPVVVSEELRQIGDRLRNQDNRCTANPIFLVRGKERIYGLDSSASDEIVWMDDEWNPVEIPEGADPEEPPHGLTVARYTTRWKALMVAFTEQGCKEHLRLNGHNCRMYDEVGIYVDSLNRCPEMIAIREFLLGLPAPQAGEVEA